MSRVVAAQAITSVVMTASASAGEAREKLVKEQQASAQTWTEANQKRENDIESLKAEYETLISRVRAAVVTSA